MREIIAGILVGIANVIPGVSGGTMLVICGVFEKMTASISDLLHKEQHKRRAAIIFLMKLLLGVGVGVIVFAKLLNAILFRYFPVQTIFWFIGMVVASVLIFKQKEMKAQKLNYFTFGLGVLIIMGIMYYAPEKTHIVLDQLPNITFSHLILMVMIGMIGGFSMIIPGVSGSLILLIIGQYYLFTTYIAKVTTLQIQVLVPLCFIGLGVLIGIFVSSKLCRYLFEVAPAATNSFILGLIVASAVVLFPYQQLTLTLSSSLSYFGVFIVGYVMVIVMNYTISKK